MELLVPTIHVISLIAPDPTPNNGWAKPQHSDLAVEFSPRNLASYPTSNCYALPPTPYLDIV